jgi:hypothetical protein
MLHFVASRTPSLHVGYSNTPPVRSSVCGEYPFRQKSAKNSTQFDMLVVEIGIDDVICTFAPSYFLQPIMNVVTKQYHLYATVILTVLHLDLILLNVWGDRQKAEDVVVW